MKELTLQELKKIEFDILKFFDAFCKENNIRYFLSHGTLLGAVRYKKFIPWDDDIDILVPREDYDRLLALFRDSEKYHLFAFEKDKNYHFPFAKLCDMTTRKEETVYPNKGIDLGVEIDIFPLDSFDNDLNKARKEAKLIQRYMSHLGCTKLNKPLTQNPFKLAVWGVILAFDKMLGGEYFVKKIINECCKKKQKESTYVGAKA